MSEICDLEPELRKEKIILNNVTKPSSHIANFVCLIAKQYIYRQRCLGEALSAPQFRRLVWNTKNFEKFYATKNKKMEHFNRKWFVKENCN